MRRGAAVLAAGLFLMAFAPAARAACVVPVLDDYIESFSRHPELILEDAPQGGEKLWSKIRTLSTAGYAPLKAIESIVPKANTKQREAIGQGLGRANEACVARAGELAHRIDDSVRRMKDRDVTRAYLKVLMPDDPPASVPSAGTGDAPARKTLDLDSPIGSLKPHDDFSQKR